MHTVLILNSPRTRPLAQCLLGLLLAVFSFISVKAQTGGEAGIQGTVVDSTGAAVPDAVVTATNNATGVANQRKTTGAGLYTIAPIIPGTYTITVTAKGFQLFRQENFSLDALKLTGLDVKLTVGSETAEVTVSSAPPALETTNATLGGVLENSTYENLPLQMSGQQRDPTAFATLLPGVQPGARAPIIGGTGNYLAAVYVDGIPVTTINQNGDNRIVSNAVPVEAIDQFQVITSGAGAEYQGAGLVNFSLKSGGQQYHGILAAFVRNTIFDTWGFSAPALTCPNGPGGTLIQCPKPVEHQNELVASGGGPIPFTRHKGYFYATFDKYHGRNGINPNYLTVPTAKMRMGNFSELLSTSNTGVTTGKIYDPTSTAACTAANAGVLCRTQYPGNIIPMNQLSPIALKMQSFLPAPTNGNLTMNLLAGVPSGYDNHEFTTRVDFDVTSKQRLSYILTFGTRTNVPFTVGGSPAGVVLPLPYTAGGYATIKPLVTDVEHAWQISDHLVNQFKFAFNRFIQPVGALTDGISPYQAGKDLGITNLPAGQAQTEFPGATFGATTLFTTVETPWTSNGASGATQTTVPSTFTLLDNFVVTKGRHSVTAGIQFQWLQDNAAAQLGPSGIYTIPYSASSTAPYSGTSLSSSSNGFSYASFLLGAAGSSGIAVQQVAETGGRYHDISPYVQDDWKVTPKLTVNLGLRWDYFPPFHEVQDRWSFLNPDITNTATGSKGALQFAGYRGDAFSCQCRTPVQTWMKNFGPRVGFAYSVTPSTVIRASYALVYSIGGGVGGRQGAATGTGAAGFNITAQSPAEVTTGAAAGPSYFLNNSAYFTSIGKANTAFGGPGYAIPAPTMPGVAAQTLNTGNYVNASGAYVTPSTTAYADPYLSGRAPEFNFYNAGIQTALTNNLTLTMNYAGTQSHFLLATGNNARGLYTNQLDPALLAALGPLVGSDGRTPLLTSKTTPANLMLVQKALPGYNPAYASLYASNSTASVAQSLVAFPQYSGISDTWGNVANISYNSLQVSLNQRLAHNVSFTFNYTWSQNIGDDGTFRSGYDLPASATSNGVAYKANRIDRSPTTTDIPQNFSFFGVYKSPFGVGGLGSSHRLLSVVAGGWQLSNILTAISGTPVVITYTGCTSPNLGQCAPDLNPNYVGNGKKNGGFGKGVTAANIATTQYLDNAAFQVPNVFQTSCVSTASAPCTYLNKIGTAPRTAPFGLHGPGRLNLDLSLRRTFPIKERFNFVVEADCLNVANHPTLQNLSGVASSTAFGTFTGATGNRDFQFAGRLNF